MLLLFVSFYGSSNPGSNFDVFLRPMRVVYYPRNKLELEASIGASTHFQYDFLEILKLRYQQQFFT